VLVAKGIDHVPDHERFRLFHSDGHGEEGDARVKLEVPSMGSTCHSVPPEPE